MAYEGEFLNACGLVRFDASSFEVVAVSGDGPNKCGHLLLFSPAGGGHYFHVAGLYGQPRYMTEAGYRRYLKDNGKSELRRLPLHLPDPDGANRKMEALLSDEWLWGGLVNNCVSFVEEIIAAGGGDWGSYSNCPAVATQDSVQQRVNYFFQWMESQIYSLYGVPR